MALAGVVVLVVAALLVVVGVTAAAGARSARAGSAETDEVHGPTATYRVPDGQDPVAVLAHLRDSGFEAHAADPGDPLGPQVVVVPCRTDDRDRLRSAIASAPTSASDHTASGTPAHQVRFTDE